MATLFTNVRIFDGTANPARSGSVLVDGTTIARVAYAPETIAAAAHDTVIDGDGRTLMPGLVEAHAHLTWGSSVEKIYHAFILPPDELEVAATRNARVLLDHGFTSLWSGGALGDGIEARLAARIAGGEVPGPRLVPSTLERSPEGDGIDTGDVFNGRGPDAMRAFFAHCAAQGVKTVKLVISGESALKPNSHADVLYSPEEMDAAREAAAEHGLAITCHAYTDEAVDLALRAGARIIYHMSYISDAMVERLAGLKDTRTGDTLCDPLKSPVILEKMEFPAPVIEIAIEPKSKADQEKLGVALQKLASEDPSFSVSTDLESGQTILKGMGELHLDIKVDILRRTYKVEANVGAPQVAYRESLGKKVEIDYTHKKQTGGTGQFARVKIIFEPGEPGSGYQFESAIVGGSVPKEFIPGVTKGIESSKDNGLLAGFPLIDFKATLIDGAYHDVDSSVLAFEIAARAAFRELRERGAPKLLEPIMKVEVLTPDEYLGDVIGDLNSRRGQIQGTDQRGNAQVVSAFVPLANMFGYVNNLRGMSQGRAQFTMTYDHYEQVPQHVADEVIKKYA